MVPQSEAHQYYSSSGNIGGSFEGALSKSDFAVEVVTCKKVLTKSKIKMVPQSEAHQYYCNVAAILR